MIRPPSRRNRREYAFEEEPWRWNDPADTKWNPEKNIGSGSGTPTGRRRTRPVLAGRGVFKVGRNPLASRPCTSGRPDRSRGARTSSCARTPSTCGSPASLPQNYYRRIRRSMPEICRFHVIVIRMYSTRYRHISMRTAMEALVGPGEKESGPHRDVPESDGAMIAGPLRERCAGGDALTRRAINGQRRAAMCGEHGIRSCPPQASPSDAVRKPTEGV